MRVLFLANTLAFGGMEAYTFTLMKALQDQGHECVALAARVRESAHRQADWCGVSPDAVRAAPRLSVPWLREWVRQENIELVVTSPPIQLLGEPEPYALGCREVCLLHSHYSTFGWRPNGRPVVTTDEVLAQRYRAQAVLPVPVDLARFRFYGGPRDKGVCSAGRVRPEILGPALEARVPVDLYGVRDEPGAEPVQGVACLPAVPLESVLWRYRVCLGAGLVAVEAMASGCLTVVSLDTLDPQRRFRRGFDGLMTAETVQASARYTYRGFMVHHEDREPHQLALRTKQALALRDEVRTAVARDCRGWVEERHDARKVAQTLLALAA